MSAPFVQIPLVRMVDLAISTNEGQVNFNLLQALLYALIQNSNAQSVAVEIHGAEAIKLQEQLKTVPDKPTYTIKEATDKSEKGKDQTIYVMQPETMYQGSSSVAKEKIDILEAEMEEIKKQITELRDLPGNLGIIDAVKNFDEKTSTVIDVLHMLTLQKRIEAAEEGMVKIASIVEDLIKSPGGITLDARSVICQKEEETSEVKTVSSFRRESKTITTEIHGRGPGSPGESHMVEPDARLKQLIKDVDDIKAFLKIKPQKSTDAINAITEEEEGLTAILPDEKLKDVIQHVEHLELTVNEEITRLHNQFTDIEKDFNELLNKCEMGGVSDDPNAPNTCCNTVYQKLVQLEAEVADMNETSVRLLDDKDEKTKVMDMLVEQIEVLKSVKADREELEEALADKADACAVLRKVSHDQFDNACEELSKGVGEALEKLSQQELLWQQALEDIQADIGNKLDKMDLGPLREFINNKLRQLQDKMKSLADLKREQEAAGTKNKLLRDVTCISCDKEVVMKKDYDLSFRPMAAGVPPTRSMAPYLAYELDALRKQQKTVPGGKNMFSFEAAMHGRVQKKSEDHLCNRYCGGSHTVTTPHQRVTRLGHFLMQWGPEAQPAAAVGEKKSGSLQQVGSAEKPAEGATTPTKLSSKTEQAKRTSKTSRASKEEDLKRASQDSKKAGAKSPSPKKGSIASQEGSTSKVRTSARPSKQPIVEEHESAEGATSKSSLTAAAPAAEEATVAPEAAEAEEAANEGGAAEDASEPQDAPEQPDE